jgi:2-C-methyl-D-erythritol 2,4-cyclodiphosphate synthase
MKAKTAKSPRRKAARRGIPLTRFGIGYDAHRFVEGRRLVLGGVPIDSVRGLAGHSDADVLLHAVMDALLGAAALGDIGQHFPNSDPAFKDASSLALLEETCIILEGAGYVPIQVDATLIAEEPRVSPYVSLMRATIATALGVDESCVSIKATTQEGMGSIGRREGAAAMAIAQIGSLDTTRRPAARSTTRRKPQARAMS